MVMYRDFAQRKGRGLGISGTVQNLKDGRVHIIVQGLEPALTRYVEILRKGPFLSRVTDVEVEWREPTRKFMGFQIIY